MMASHSSANSRSGSLRVSKIPGPPIAAEILDGGGLKSFIKLFAGLAGVCYLAVLPVMTVDTASEFHSFCKIWNHIVKWLVIILR